MPLISLKRHPSTPAPAVRQMSAGVRRAGITELSFRFVLEGDLGALCIPSLSAGKRTDGLWRTTCFEAFLKCDGSEEYLEFNFAPSSDWAAYEFHNYRQGMRESAIDAPTITFDRKADRLTLDAAVKFDQANLSCESAPLLVALSAVVEANDGGMSYWALSHPTAKPDFHHPLGFAHELRKDACK